MRGRLLALAALAAVAAAALASLPAAGTFAAQSGFSGRFADCTACHNRPLPGLPAAAHLEGLPDAYEPGATYTLRVAVTGGPPALPPPAPQGGFELEADGGAFHQPEAMAALLRQDGPRVVTYEPAGTLRRDWEVAWSAPPAHEEPRPVRFWLAVVSASGDHLVAANASDLGERFDSAATLQAEVMPAAAAVQAWRSLPLAAPAVTLAPGPLPAGDDLVLDVALPDGNTTRLLSRLDAGAWNERAASATARLRLSVLEPGPHTLELQAAGANRTSPVTAVLFEVADASGNVPHRDAPPHPLAALLALTVGLASARLRHRRTTILHPSEETR